LAHTLALRNSSTFRRPEQPPFLERFRVFNSVGTCCPYNPFPLPPPSREAQPLPHPTFNQIFDSIFPKTQSSFFQLLAVSPGTAGVVPVYERRSPFFPRVLVCRGSKLINRWSLAPISSPPPLPGLLTRPPYGSCAWAASLVNSPVTSLGKRACSCTL